MAEERQERRGAGARPRRQAGAGRHGKHSCRSWMAKFRQARQAGQTINNTG
ncbi:hypothetical protein PCLA_14f0260 [Pseudomonas citronellolis]|nr:hypothetical protein PCLA_14f0260 [Pseudomonas citronellolis]